MSPRARAGRTGALPLLVLLAATACDRADAEPQLWAVPPVRVAPAAASPESGAVPTRLEPAALAAVRGEVVVGRTGPAGQPFEVAVRTPDRAGHDRVIGRQTFGIALRSAAATDYPCGSCHQPGRPVIRPERSEDAHRNLLPRHPDESGSRCVTCHAPDDVERLVLASGERVPLGHAYRLCGQCHYAQVDAWAAGAHGKRLDGWSGRRVVMGCADCHDPHQPALEPRTPFPGPRLPRTGRQSP